MSFSGGSLRRLSTSASISISKAKSKLRGECDPDKALEIYSSVSSGRHSSSQRYAQGLAVRRLAESHRFSDIESFIESHKQDPKITQEPYLSDLIRSYGRAGMLDHALKTFDQMDQLGTPRSSISFNSLLTACNLSKKHDMVHRLFQDIPVKYGLSPDKVSYGILIKSYCEAGAAEKAIQTLRMMQENGVEVTPVAFTTVYNALYKKGDKQEAESLWDEMVVGKCCEVDVAAYNVKIMYAHLDGEPEIVKRLIHEMSCAGLKPDAISFNYLMGCYCRCGMMEEAEKVYKGMERNGCNPNAATFRTLISCLCENDEFDKGYRVFKRSVEMQKMPDINTLKCLMEGLVKHKRRKEAKGLIRTVKKKFPPNAVKSWERLEKGIIDGSDAVGSDVDAQEAKSSKSKLGIGEKKRWKKFNKKRKEAKAWERPDMKNFDANGVKKVVEGACLVSDAKEAAAQV